MALSVAFRCCSSVSQGRTPLCPFLQTVMEPVRIIPQAGAAYVDGGLSGELSWWGMGTKTGEQMGTI